MHYGWKGACIAPSVRMKQPQLCLSKNGDTGKASTSQPNPCPHPALSTSAASPEDAQDPEVGSVDPRAGPSFPLSWLPTCLLGPFSLEPQGLLQQPPSLTVCASPPLPSPPTRPLLSSPHRVQTLLSAFSADSNDSLNRGWGWGWEGTEQQTANRPLWGQTGGSSQSGNSSFI